MAPGHLFSVLRLKQGSRLKGDDGQWNTVDDFHLSVGGWGLIGAREGLGRGLERGIRGLGNGMETWAVRSWGLEPCGDGPFVRWFGRMSGPLTNNRLDAPQFNATTRALPKIWCIFIHMFTCLVSTFSVLRLF